MEKAYQTHADFFSLVKESDSEKLNRELDEEFTEYAAYRKQFEAEWEECERFYEGDHWKTAKDRTFKNWVFAIIESEVPILCDSRPASTVVPYEDDQEGGQSNEGKAKILSGGTEWVYNNQNFELKLAEAMRECLITGTAWQYVDFDPDLDNGEGNITIQNLEWKQVFCDGSAGDIDGGKSAHILFPTRISELKRRYPNAKDIPHITWDDALQGKSRTDGTPVDRWTPENMAGDEVSKYQGPDFTVLSEVWRRDYTQEEIPDEVTQMEIEEENEQFREGRNPDIHKYENHQAHLEAHGQTKRDLFRELFNTDLGLFPPDLAAALIDDPTRLLEFNPTIDPGLIEEAALMFQVIKDHEQAHEALMELNPEGKRPKYKNNLRLIQRVGHEILYDGQSSVPEDGLIPLIPYYAYKRSGKIYARGEVYNILKAQKSYNELDHSEYKGLKKNSNSGWIKDDTSGVKNDSLTNDEAIVITKKQGTTVERLDPGQVSPQLSDRMFRDQEAMRTISGQHEASSGKRPAGITAAKAIERLQEASVGRIRQKTRQMEGYSILRAGRLIASRIIRFWSTERKLRLWDDFGKIRYVHFDPEQMGDFRYDVMIAPGTTAGISKEVIYELYGDMLAKGGITPKIFFQITDLPHKHKVLDLLDQADQEKMLLEQLAMENEQLKMALAEYAPELMGEQQKQPKKLPAKARA